MELLNFRKLGNNLVNKEGLVIQNIYRSADLHYASDEDLELLKSLEIHNVIDLRSHSEISKFGIRSNDFLNIKQVTILESAKQNELEKVGINEMVEIMHKLYEVYFVESLGFRREFEHILSLEGKPFLFHCVAGKDRTGITGAILMHILEFDFDEIMDEYLQIDPRLVTAVMQKVEVELQKRDIDYNRESVVALASIVPSFLESFLIGITDKYGTVDNYITNGLGISEDDINQLKSYYLTKP